MLKLPVSCNLSQWVQGGVQRKMMEVTYNASESGVSTGTTETEFEFDLRSDMQRFGLKDIQGIQWDGRTDGSDGYFESIISEYSIPNLNPLTAYSRVRARRVRNLRLRSDVGQSVVFQEYADSASPFFSRGLISLKLDRPQEVGVDTLRSITLFVFDWEIAPRFPAPNTHSVSIQFPSVS